MAGFIGNGSYKTCGKHDTTKHSELFQIGMQPHKACAPFCPPLHDVNPALRERVQGSARTFASGSEVSFPGVGCPECLAGKQEVGLPQATVIVPTSCLRQPPGIVTRISRQSPGAGTGRAMTACGPWRRSNSFRTGAWPRPLRILPGSGGPGVLRRSGMRRGAAA